MNLIGKSTEPEVWENHVRDSLELLPFLKNSPVRNVIDIGSGGGIPAIPLSIMVPDKAFIVTDIDSKKLAFLEFTVKKLKLNVTVADLNRDFFFGKENLVTCRAFSEIANIMKWKNEHVANNRGMYLLKGREEVVQEELAQAGIRDAVIHKLEKGCIVEIR